MGKGGLLERFSVRLWYFGLKFLVNSYMQKEDRHLILAYGYHDYDQLFYLLSHKFQRKLDQTPIDPLEKIVLIGWAEDQKSSTII